MKGPLDLDTRCGVYDEKKGAVCQRRITCKVHSMHAKRQLPGRSKNFDELLLEYRRIHDPKFVEPVPKKPKEKKEPGVPGVGKDGLTKKERKELREKERMEKREADIRAGLIDPNDPAHALPQPKKKKKKPAAPSAPGATGGKKGSGTSGSGGAGGTAGAGSGANGSAPGEWDSMNEDEIAELDSDVEIDKLVSAVSRSKRTGQQTSAPPGYSLFPHSVLPSGTSASGGILVGQKGGSAASNTAASQNLAGGPTPLARPTNTTHYFVARNEVLRCCADILLKALPRPANSATATAATSVGNSNGPAAVSASTNSSAITGVVTVTASASAA
ncbi:SCA7, zinc-binding domain-containing protein [Cantharellus anzutake]|uniref:SCA7, zinc-binding domain-containing protein n=1 Tax=Cantharellus anzutake TaxID=1750568 RepID=UPI00190326E1|nr:SCA7, zinc-binding domain-containing protein [Cantharellus anzutake]KAF8334687.1 SCA7, zinc-binding domain-containing protein [Cantharellus anzutake]